MSTSGNVSCRTVFISDIHLGTRGCQADLLLSFIRSFDAQKIYLVGDIVDCWALRRGWFWPQTHNDVVQKLLRQARKGVQVIYIPGNHDEAFRDYVGTHFGGVEVRIDDIHTAADGKRYLVTHGDAFDGIVLYARWLALLGDWSYSMAIRLNTVVARIRARLGLPYWSLSAYLKGKAKSAVQFIASFEETVAAEARKRNVDGVICGHIHHAEIRDIDGITYVNDGDWVESCTAVIEKHDGSLEIVRWTDRIAESFDEKRKVARSRTKAA
ncbi:UDP-2,3-diacylglucosamine diphosphatase [Minwuia sp.]|uniref:UDP-2,3-diacylglucosamine diphosphatase n=1 Tax=Minwuia sp. TaxID=2493630 RepID=UPI003A95744B